MKNRATKVVAGLVALGIFFSAPQASALGDREKGALIGIAGLLTVQEIIRGSKHRQQHTQMQTQGASSYPPTTGYYDYPSFEEFRRAQIEEAYRRGTEERRMRELQEEKAEAYRCALEGTC